MGLTREERKLLHQKSKQPTFGNGKPDSNQGNEGDIAYRQVEDSGLVQYVKQNGSWVAVGSQGDMPETRDVTRTPSGGGGVGNHNHGEFIKKDGSVAYTGNQSFGTNNITNVGTLDVDGATTLDQVTINTTDGAFAVSGANPISLTTSGGSNPVTINSGGTLDVDARIVDIQCNSDYTAVVSADYSLTGSANMTIQATGTGANTLLLQNTNNHSSSFEGIHIKTDSGAASSGFNRILIECDNIASKGADYGIDVRSENNIRIRAENANNGNPTGLLMRATGPIDIGVGTSLTPHSGNERVKVHGLFETSTLYRASGEAINCSTHSVEFDQLDTPKLMRNFTYKAGGTVADGNSLLIVSDTNQDDTDGTVWLVTVNFKVGTRDGITIGYCFKNGGQRHDPEDIGYVVRQYQESTGGFPSSTSVGQINWGPGSGVGIQWINNSGAEATVKASAQRIQSGNDFS